MKENILPFDPSIRQELFWETLEDGTVVPTSLVLRLYGGPLLTEAENKELDAYLESFNQASVEANTEDPGYQAFLARAKQIEAEVFVERPREVGAGVALVAQLFETFQAAMQHWSYGPQSLKGLAFAARGGRSEQVEGEGETSIHWKQALPVLRQAAVQLRTELAGTRVDLSQLDEMLDWLDSVRAAEPTAAMMQELGPCLVAMRDYIEEATTDWAAMGGTSAFAVLDIVRAIRIEEQNEWK